MSLQLICGRSHSGKSTYILDVIENLIDTIRTTNLYNSINYVDNQGIDNDGLIFNASGWSRTGYIPVEAGESYYITAKNITRTTNNASKLHAIVNNELFFFFFLVAIVILSENNKKKVGLFLIMN